LYSILHWYWHSVRNRLSSSWFQFETKSLFLELHQKYHSMSCDYDFKNSITNLFKFFSVFTEFNIAITFDKLMFIFVNSWNQLTEDYHLLFSISPVLFSQKTYPWNEKFRKSTYTEKICTLHFRTVLSRCVAVCHCLYVHNNCVIFIVEIAVSSVNSMMMKIQFNFTTCNEIPLNRSSSVNWAVKADTRHELIHDAIAPLGWV